jgi:2-polyprenyl-3-methyl-5-hydroxy-6-metoxy-1,4-benzoquinol methylase
LTDPRSDGETGRPNLLTVDVAAETRTYKFIPTERCNMCGEREAEVLGKRLSGPQRLRPAKRVGVTTTIVRCPRCGLVYCNPQPVPLSIASHYDVPPEEYWEASRLEVANQHFAEHLETFRQLGGEVGTALDVGAGVGQIVVALTRAGFETWGLEPSEAFFRRAVSRPEVSADRMLLSTAEEASFEPESFSFVSFAAVLEHLYDPCAALLRALDWLRPGGLIYLDVPSADFLSNRIVNWAYKLQGLDYVANLSPMHPPYHLYEFTVRSFMEHAQIHNHAVASHRTHVTGETYLPLSPLVRWLMRRSGGGMQLEVWLRKAQV